MKKTDLRVIKTQKVLYETLIKLLKTKSFEEIKVSDICNEALINRSTFYAHYNDKYELLVDYIDNLKTKLIEALNKNENIANSKEYYLDLIRLLLDHIDEEKEIYQAILINNRNSVMVDILLDVVTKDLKMRLQEDNISTGGIPSEIVSRFYLGAVVCLGIEWLNNSSKYTKEDIINYLEKLIPDNTNFIINL